MGEKEQRDKEDLRKRTLLRPVRDRRQSIILHHKLLKFEGQNKRSGADRRSGDDRRVLVKMSE